MFLHVYPELVFLALTRVVWFLTSFFNCSGLAHRNKLRDALRVYIITLKKQFAFSFPILGILALPRCRGANQRPIGPARPREGRPALPCALANSSSPFLV